MPIKKYQVIEPSTIRLTSEETRALMRIALSPQSVGVSYGGKGIIDLGLVKPMKRKRNDKVALKMEILRLKKRLGGNYARIARLVAEIDKKQQSLRYMSKAEQLYGLTAAGKSLIKTVTIRRR